MKLAVYRPNGGEFRDFYLIFGGEHSVRLRSGVQLGVVRRGCIVVRKGVKSWGGRIFKAYSEQGPL